MIQANPSLSATQGKGKISQKQFFNLCTSRQLNVRRLLETLGASKVNNCWVIKFKKIIRVKFIWLSDCLIIWLFFSFIAFDCFSAFRFFYFLYFLPFLFPYFLIFSLFYFFTSDAHRWQQCGPWIQCTPCYAKSHWRGKLCNGCFCHHIYNIQ